MTALAPGFEVQRRAASWIGVALGLVLVLSATMLQMHPTYRTPSSVGRAPAGGTGVLGTDHTAESVPQQVAIPSLGVAAPTEAVAVEAGQLRVPESGRTVGWWRNGAAPGDSVGTVILAGHVDTVAQGPGAFYRLESAPPGALVTIETGAGAVSYRIEGRRAYRKAELPRDLFSADGPARLVLITCGGAFDRSTRTYAYNVVVYGEPLA